MADPNFLMKIVRTRNMSRRILKLCLYYFDHCTDRLHSAHQPVPNYPHKSSTCSCHMFA